MPRLACRSTPTIPSRRCSWIRTIARLTVGETAESCLALRESTSRSTSVCPFVCRFIASCAVDYSSEIKLLPGQHLFVPSCGDLSSRRPSKARLSLNYFQVNIGHPFPRVMSGLVELQSIEGVLLPGQHVVPPNTVAIFFAVASDWIEGELYFQVNIVGVPFHARVLATIVGDRSQGIALLPGQHREPPSLADDQRQRRRKTGVFRKDRYFHNIDAPPSASSRAPCRRAIRGVHDGLFWPPIQGPPAGRATLGVSSPCTDRPAVEP